MYKRSLIIIAACLVFSVALHAQKGSLFIIGGGDRTPAIMKAMMQTAQLSKTDYICYSPNVKLRAGYIILLYQTGS